MWYCLIKYSFDSEKPVLGPFATETEAWDVALSNANKEFDIDKNENEWDVDMMVYEDIGEIVLVNHFVDGDDTTEWIVFEI